MNAKYTWPLFALALAACQDAPKREADQWPLSKAALHAPADQRGEVTYRRYCVACHGTDGRGNKGVTGADFVGTASVLSLKPDAELQSSVRDGKRGATAVMPAHKPVLSEAQIADAVAFVRTRFITPNAAVAAQDTAAPDAAAAAN